MYCLKTKKLWLKAYQYLLLWELEPVKKIPGAGQKRTGSAKLLKIM